MDQRQVEVGGVYDTVDQEATMDADLDLLLISVCCTADDLLPERPRNARRKLSDARAATGATSGYARAPGLLP
jgi:hypothetical protein